MHNKNELVPHLTTALEGPLHELEKVILKNQVAIESWLREQWRLTPPVFYSSVDLRNAGFKLAPVDTNLFPAGFNNLNPDFLPLCIQAVQATMEQLCPSTRRILLIPESHTRNPFYFEHLANLYTILIKSGFDVRIGSLLEDLTEPRLIETKSGKKFYLEPLQREGNKIGVHDFKPCFVLLNNDLSDEIPDILKNLDQMVMPTPKLGWSTRLKSHHFQHYADIANELGKLINLDPWLISPLFRYCGEVDFMTGEGQECLTHHAEALLETIHEKYREYKIKEEPFLAIKADAGTYGMAIMMIKKAADLQHLNRKERTRMSTLKGGQSVSRVIIQEGVHSFETWGSEHHVAEPVVYMIGRFVIGGFYRVHADKNIMENLNSPGMNFEPLAFAESCNYPSEDIKDCTNRFYAYGVIARLANLAAAREWHDLKT